MTKCCSATAVARRPKRWGADVTDDELYTRFTYHPPKGDQAERYEQIRQYGRQFADLIDGIANGSRELSLALIKVEEAVMWANAAIARRE
jgi:hypothetical protein